MNEFVIKQGRVEIIIKSMLIGNDLCIIISGGDAPHIGSITLSICRESLKDANINSCTTSVLNLLGHKDEKVIRYVAEKISPILEKNVVIIGGIHINKIKTKEIDFILNSLDEIVEQIIGIYKIKL